MQRLLLRWPLAFAGLAAARAERLDTGGHLVATDADNAQGPDEEADDEKKSGWGPHARTPDGKIVVCHRNLIGRNMISRDTSCETAEQAAACINKYSGNCSFFLSTERYGDISQETRTDRYKRCLAEFHGGARLHKVRRCLHNFVNKLDLTQPHAAEALYDNFAAYCSNYVCHKETKRQDQAKQTCQVWAQPRINEAYCNELCDGQGGTWEAIYTGTEKAMAALTAEAQQNWPTLQHARAYNQAKQAELQKAQKSYRNRDKLPEFQAQAEAAQNLLYQWEESYRGYEAEKTKVLQIAGAKCKVACHAQMHANWLWGTGISQSEPLRYDLGGDMGWRALLKPRSTMRDSVTFKLAEAASC